MLKNQEDEESFWQEMRNTNLDSITGDGREEEVQDGDEVKGEEERKHRRSASQVGRGKGIDGDTLRGRQGQTRRLRGGGGGGGGGHAEGDGAERSGTMGKLARRRKDQNKAKVANHNRKAGATRKLNRAGGFPPG